MIVDQFIIADISGNQVEVTTTQADNLANTLNSLNVSSFLYGFDGTTWDRLKGDSTDGLLVNLGANNDVAVTGSVTANAGTNLNTSLLALEGGGNLATIAGKDFATQTTLASLLTSSQLLDDVVVVLGTATYSEATSKGDIIAAVRRDADTTLVDTTNEFAPLQLDARGFLKVEVFSGEALPVTLTSTTITGTVAATQSGTWVLGANSGVDIGDVDVTSLPAITIAAAQTLATVTTLGTITNVVHVDDNSSSLSIDIGGTAPTLGATANVASISGLLAVAPVGVYNATPVTLTDTRFSNLQLDINGYLKTNITNTVTVGSHAVTNAGTFVVQENGAALTSLQLIDDTVYGSDAALSKTLGIAAVFDDVATVAITENQAGYLRMSSRRALLVEGVASGTAINTSLAAETTKVIGTVNIAGSQTIAVTNAGTFVTQIDGAALTSLQLSDDVVYTDDTSTHATGTSKGTGIMAVANPTDAAVDANDIGMVAMTLARALKNDITTIAGTAPTTAGFIDIKGADGNIFIRQTTASNLNMTEASAASILTSVQLIDDIVYTDDTSTHSTGTSKGALMMAAATPTDTAVNANDIGALAMTLNRELLVQVNTALPAGTNAIGKLAANAGVTIGAVEIAASQTLSTVTTVSTVTTLTGTTTLTPGTAAANLGKAEDAVAGSGDTGLFSLSVANEAQSALAADGDYIARAADTKGNSMMVGNVAHDGVDAGNPVKMGLQARTTNPTAVADADRVNAMGDKVGRQVVRLGQIRDLVTSATTTIAASTVETTILSAGAAGVFHDVVMITVANTSATATRVDFRDTTGGSVVFSLYCAAGVTTGFVNPMGINQTTAATNWTATCITSLTDLRIYIQAVKNI